MSGKEGDLFAERAMQRRAALLVVVGLLVVGGGVGVAAYLIWRSRKQATGGGTPPNPPPPQPKHMVLAGAGRCAVPLTVTGVDPKLCQSVGGKPLAGTGSSAGDDACELSVCANNEVAAPDGLSMLNSPEQPSHPDPYTKFEGVIARADTTPEGCAACGGAGSAGEPCVATFGHADAPSAVGLVSDGATCAAGRRYAAVLLGDRELTDAQCAAIGGARPDGGGCRIGACVPPLAP
jgi:hypothetical protein